MKRICFFNSTSVWGGGEKWHVEIAGRLHERGWPVLLMTNPGSALFHKAQARQLPVLQCRISNLSFLNPFKLFNLYHVFKTHQIDTIILNLSADMKAGGIAAKLAGIPQIIYRRGLDWPARPSLVNRWVFRHVLTHVIVNTQELRRTFPFPSAFLPAQVPGNGQHSEDRIQVIYNGLDLEAYDQAPGQPVYTKRRPDEIVLGNAGRLVEQKGQHYLLEMAKELKARHLTFTLLIAGSGKRESELREYARVLDVEQEVRFLGFVENIRSFMESLDIFLLSSLYEGFAHVLLEAMAARKPVVAFRVSGNPEIVEHGRTGFLVDLGDVAALIECVDRLSHDQQLRRTLGYNGRRRAEEHFTIARTLNDVIALLNSEG